jgi:hypothetical protein
MIVSAVVVSGCGNDKLSDDAYGFIDLAPYYYDGSSAANPSAGLPREFAPTQGLVNGVRTEFYDFGLVGVTKKRTDTKLPDYASVPPMYFFFDSGGTRCSRSRLRDRTGLWHMRGGTDVLNPNPVRNAPKNVPYSVRTRQPSGASSGRSSIASQHNTDYSGLWEIWEVTAPDGYVPDAIKTSRPCRRGSTAAPSPCAGPRRSSTVRCSDDRQYVVPTPLYYGIPHPRIELWYRTKQGSCFLADGMLTLGSSTPTPSHPLQGELDSKRLQTFDVISLHHRPGESARTTITARSRSCSSPPPRWPPWTPAARSTSATPRQRGDGGCPA